MTGQSACAWVDPDAKKNKLAQTSEKADDIETEVMDDEANETDAEDMDEGEDSYEYMDEAEEMEAQSMA